MKKIFLLTALAVMVLASCGKENGTDNLPQEGAKATLSIKMAFPRTTRATYAAADEVASPAESAVSDIDVFIFDAGNGALITHRELTMADFDQAPANTYTSTTEIVTTSGERRVGIGINLPASIVSAITTDRNFNVVTQTAHDVTKTLIASDGKFVMFNVEMPAVTIIPDDEAQAGDNQFTMDIERLAGKAALITTDGFSYGSMVTDVGTFGQLEYKLMQTNKKSFLMRESTRKDPNYRSEDFNPGGPATYPEYDETAFENTEDEEYIAVETTSDYADHSERPAFYGAENTSDFYQKATTTYFLVRARFTPTKFSNEEGADITSSVTYTPEQGFWVVTDGELAHICLTETAANTLKSKETIFPNGATATGHVGGYCYWPVWIGNPNAHEFLRNNYHLGQIEAINGFGKGNEEDVTTPPEGSVDDDEKATIQCTFTVLPWTFNPADAVILN